MRLREYFYQEDEDPIAEEEEKEGEKSDKKKKSSNFTPGRGRNRWLGTYIDCVRDDIIAGLKANVKWNITKEEKIAMKEHLSDDTLVIRQADKGSGFVILDREDYIEKQNAELKDSKTYKQTDEDLTKQINSKVRRLVNKMYKQGVISSELRQYLLPSICHPGRLKGNPKIHTAGNPMRTIISGIGTATEKVAEGELEEFVVRSPSYIQDTTYFINQVKDIIDLPDDTILFCFDVCKLYPSIPKEEGSEACKEAVASPKTKGIRDEDVISIMRLMLENNNFQFNGQHYLQVDGTTIGSRLGKIYVYTYMRKKDEQLLQFPQKPYLYKRYIDDGIGIWTEG